MGAAAFLFALAFFSPAGGVHSLWKECLCSPTPNNGVLASCLIPNKRQMMEMNAVDFSENLTEIEISGGKELRFGEGVLTRLGGFEALRVRNMSKVLVRKHAFANLSRVGGSRFELTDLGSVVVEEESWRAPLGPVSVLLARIDQVVLQGFSFSWLSDLLVSDVRRLEIHQSAFFIEWPHKPLDSFYRPTTITFQNVGIDRLVEGTFRSRAKEVRVSGSVVKTIKTDAFDSFGIENVVLENTTIHHIETEAFPNKLHMTTSLTMDNVSIHELATNAVLSGSTYLLIKNSRLGVLRKGALNMTVATAVFLNNVFRRTEQRAIDLRLWNTLTIEGNSFLKVDAQGFSALPAAPPLHFSFTANRLEEFRAEAFDIPLPENVSLSLGENLFAFKCNCDMEGPIVSLLASPQDVKELLYNSALCFVDSTLAACFDLPRGHVNVFNFTGKVCDSEEGILCTEEVQRDAAAPPLFPPSATSDIGIFFDDRLRREKRILAFVVIGVLAFTALTLLISAFIWVRGKGRCAKMNHLPSLGIFRGLFSSGRATPVGSAHSISRLSIHEYAELQKKAREIKVEEEEEGDDISLEDKATQTLPEELTQELLQSLKEKLNDPENYSEARDMIEHLYDLIKVEESCNKNYRDSNVSINLEDLAGSTENVYDVIRPKRGARVKRETASTGTRVPSPDKLLPYGVRGPLLCETYTEPLDRKLHTYAEPRGLGSHVYAELHPATRPLPPSPSDL